MYNTNTNKQSSDSDAAKPNESTMNNNDTNHADCEGCNPPMGVQDVKGVNIPEWVKSQPAESAVKWDDKGFFYLTDEDHKNGKSNDHHALPEPFSKRSDYDFGPFGKLRAVLIEGLAWCSLEDAGQVAGVPTSWITGYLPEDQDHVRGVPGQLEPEGIRYLRPQGIRDSGIRLDALVKHVEEHRGDDPRVSKMLASAIADIYDKDLPGEVSMDTRRIDLWRPHASPKKPGQIFKQALY